MNKKQTDKIAKILTGLMILNYDGDGIMDFLSEPDYERFEKSRDKICKKLLKFSELELCTTEEIINYVKSQKAEEAK